METVSIKQEGDDLAKLDYRARLSLAILLDQNEEWRRLCHLMNLAPLEGGFATFTSPTKDMLAMFQVRVQAGVQGSGFKQHWWLGWVCHLHLPTKVSGKGARWG